MKHTQHINTMAYSYDKAVKNAHYCVNGSYMNHGDFCEVLAKYVLGYEPTKDANTSFMDGHDIPELEASVKSFNCSLTNAKLADNATDWLAKFWEMSTAKIYIWVEENAEVVDLYYMNREEFKAFVDKFATWDKFSSKMRIRTYHKAILEWLNR